MTDEEKRQQKALLLLEYQEAEQEVAHLKERAYRMGLHLETVVCWLGYAQRRHDYDGVLDSFEANPERVREIVDADKIITTMIEWKAAKQKLSELAARKTSLGLR